MKNSITFFCSLLFIISGSAVIAQIPANEPVGYWPFNSNADDRSGNEHHGTLYNAVLTTDRFGISDRAYEFNGTDSYIEINDDTLLRLNETDFTIMFWVYKYSENSTVFISKRCEESENGFIILPAKSYSDKLTFQVSRGVDPRAYMETLIEINSWHHITVSYDLSLQQISFFLDGIFINSSTGYDNLFNPVYGIPSPGGLCTSALRFGHDTLGDYWYHGKLDDIRIYNRMLTPTEVSALYQEGQCPDVIMNDTIIYIVSDTLFESASPKIYFDSHDSVFSETGSCDSIINHYIQYLYKPYNCTEIIEVYDTTYVTVYDSISVTDTLIIDIMLSENDPPENMNTIKIYPNPASSYLIINTGNYNVISDYTITIENFLGQIVFQTLTDQPEFQIDINSIGEPGTYFISITDKTLKVITTRILILL